MLHIVIKDNFREYVKVSDIIKKYLGKCSYNGCTWYIGFKQSELLFHEDFLTEISGLTKDSFYFILSLDHKITGEYYDITLDT